MKGKGRCDLGDTCCFLSTVRRRLIPYPFQTDTSNTGTAQHAIKYIYPNTNKQSKTSFSKIGQKSSHRCTHSSSVLHSAEWRMHLPEMIINVKICREAMREQSAIMKNNNDNTSGITVRRKPPPPWTRKGRDGSGPPPPTT